MGACFLPKSFLLHRAPAEATTLRPTPLPLAVLFGLTFALACGSAQAFKFSEEEDKASGEEQARAQRIGQLVSVPCKKRLKNRKIMLVIAERTANGLNTVQSRYGPHFQAINPMPPSMPRRSSAPTSSCAASSARRLASTRC